MERVDRLALYVQHYRRLAHACMDLSLTGFLVDETRRRELAGEVEHKCARLKQEIRAATPMDLFGKGKRKGEDGKGLSSLKVASYFYDHLKCKPYVKRGTGSRTADEEAIRRLMRSYKKARRVGQLILDFRMWQKRGDFLAAKRVDDDGRFRAQYVPSAETGRLKSMENPLGTGSNGQNIPRPPTPVRGIFVPDHGHVLVEWDLSRAEDRILGGMSGERRMQREAQAGPEVDTYMDVAESLGLAEHVAPQFVRQTGKRVKLAAGYGMQGMMMSRAALLETEGQLDLAPRQCDDWLTQLYKLRPGIPAYQAWVREQILRRGYLENSWGRRVYFRRLHLGDGDYRDGYAWLPQSEVGVLMNQGGFMVARRVIREKQLSARVVQQGHDSLVVSVAPQEAWQVASAIRRALHIPRTYPGAGGEWMLKMPIGLKLGPRWGTDMHEWKVWPSAEDFAEVLCRVVTATWWMQGGRGRGRGTARASSVPHTDARAG